MKDGDLNKELSYINHRDVNNLYGWKMSQKLPVNNYEWIEDTSRFKKISEKATMKKMMKAIFWKLMFNIPKNSKNFIMILPFLPERMKIEQVEKLVTNLHEKTNYVVHIRNLKQALNHGLALENIHRVIKVNQNALLNTYFNINTKLKRSNE